MKLYIIIFFAGLFLNTSQCGNEPVASKVESMEPCYTDRKVTEEIKDLTMTCMMQGDRVILNLKEENKRYSICNQDEFSWNADASYIVSGICYEIRPNERWPGTPFQVTKLTLKE